MARPLRIEFAGAIYHVTTRLVGNWKQDRKRLFEDDWDRNRFLKQLADRVDHFRLRLYLFCLMSNHLHLIVETPLANLGLFMQSLETAYTVYFNRRHQRRGHLMAGRYKARLVEGDQYLLKLTRYVHLNPVAIDSLATKSLAIRIDSLRRYRWSSYPSYIGAVAPVPFLTYEPMLGLMASNRSRAERLYREYVESGLATSDEELRKAMERSPLCIGSEGFCEQMEKQYQQRIGERMTREDISFRRVLHPVPTATVISAITAVLGVGAEELRTRRRNSFTRGISAAMLCKYSGLSQREAAKVLGIRTSSALSHQLHKLAEAAAKDENLTQLMTQLNRRLSAAATEAVGR